MILVPSFIVIASLILSSLKIYNPVPLSSAVTVPIVSNVYDMLSNVVVNFVPLGSDRNVGLPARLPVLTDKFIVAVEAAFEAGM